MIVIPAILCLHFLLIHKSTFYEKLIAKLPPLFREPRLQPSYIHSFTFPTAAFDLVIAAPPSDTYFIIFYQCEHFPFIVGLEPPIFSLTICSASNRSATLPFTIYMFHKLIESSIILPWVRGRWYPQRETWLENIGGGRDPVLSKGDVFFKPLWMV